jgi:drug/metabolite transporter (DMT)-like permease
LPEDPPNPAPPSKAKGWSLIYAGLLLLALAIVVLYTNRAAFSSPLAMVVVAAIGLAALLLQLRLRKDLTRPIRAPLWLNVVGLVFAVAAVIGDILRLKPATMLVAALGAVLCFGISGIVVFQELRKRKM